MSEQPSAQAMRELLGDLIDERGSPTDKGRAVIKFLRDQFTGFWAHLDNTEAGCWISLDEHPHCSTCNMVGEVLAALDEEWREHAAFYGKP